MVKRKLSLDTGDGISASARPRGAGGVAADPETIELFFNTGPIFHEVALPADLPDVVSGFMVVRDAANANASAPVAIRRAVAGEDPDVEISFVEHIAELSNRWFPVPYQLSCPLAVQLFLAMDVVEGEPRLRAMLAVDTLERAGSQGRHLDAALDEGRPFRPLEKPVAFLEHPETRDLLRRIEASGVEKAPLKYIALLETLGPYLPRLQLSRVAAHTPIAVSLILDLGNSRSTAALVESRDKGMFAVPLEVRSASNPFRVTDDTFDSRVTFYPSPFDKSASAVATGDSFSMPSIARMGREALDRALETPHRYACTLSGPKRYLWDDRNVDDRWHFAARLNGDHKPVFGRILKYIDDNGGGVALRADGPATPADPRYAPRAIMLFALVEILTQAYAQLNALPYRHFQGKEATPRVLKHVVLTYPSAMRDEEKAVYEVLVRNAVLLTAYMLNIPDEHRPNLNAQTGQFDPFLFVDEALAAQMVYVYEEVANRFAGSMEELVQIYGRKKASLRVASLDIGGGTSDVMIAEYEDKLPGTGTSLHIRKLFQDGVNIAGDEVCRALVEDVIFAQVLAQIPSPASRAKLVHLFGDGEGGYGASWRTLKAKMVPYLWLPLARAFWALAEGFEIPDHAPDKAYTLSDVSRIWQSPSWSDAVLAEVDQFLGGVLFDFPGMRNLVFRFDREEVDRAALSVLREPLRKYADIIAQFDVDVLVLAGRASALRCVREVLVAEMPVSPARIKTMSSYKVGEWYPSKWRELGYIKDPKSTVTAGAAVLHQAGKNRIPGFLLDQVHDLVQKPIYGLYQETEPHIARQNELFRDGATSRAFSYTNGMTIGFRNVDSQEMDGAPLFEVRPRSAEVEAALLEDRVSLSFALAASGQITIAAVTSQRDLYSFGTDDFHLHLKTTNESRYWLDSGVFRAISKYL